MRFNLVQKQCLHLRRTFFKLLPFASFSRQTCFDEVEVREKFKILGEGDVELTKMTGIQERIGVLSLCNPARKNALTGFMMVRLAECVDELEKWQSGKVVVLHGMERSFCSGADLSIIKAINTPEEGNLMCAFMQRTLTRLARLPLVSIAAIEGKALGGGAELAMACDFRLMSRDAEIQFLQVKMGLTPGWGGGARLVNQVGKQTALRLLGKAEKVNLSYGCQIGLVDGELTNDKDVVTSCSELVPEFLQSDSSVLRGIKSVVCAEGGTSLEENLYRERLIFTSLFGAEANKKALEKATKHK